MAFVIRSFLSSVAGELEEILLTYALKPASPDTPLLLCISFVGR
jgi:uncharacterized membrane protein